MNTEASKKVCLVPAVLLMVLFVAVCGYCQESQESNKSQGSKVVFECGDIGVEARRVLSRLRDERAKVAEKKKALEKRENELKILQTEVDKKIERLKQLRQELEKMLAQKEETENEKVRKLSKIYQKREPAGAAASLAAMDKQLAVSVLAMMRDKYAGEILDNMKPETAVVYSTALGKIR